MDGADFREVDEVATDDDVEAVDDDADVEDVDVWGENLFPIEATNDKALLTYDVFDWCKNTKSPVILAQTLIIE